MSPIAAGSLDFTCQLGIESVERFSGDIGKVRNELDAAGQGQDVFVVCRTEAEMQRLAEIFGGTQLAGEGRLHFPIGSLAGGFRLIPDAVVLISSGELFSTSGSNTFFHSRQTRLSDDGSRAYFNIGTAVIIYNVTTGTEEFRTDVEIGRASCRERG